MEGFYKQAVVCFFFQWLNQFEINEISIRFSELRKISGILVRVKWTAPELNWTPKRVQWRFRISAIHQIWSKSLSWVEKILETEVKMDNAQIWTQLEKRVLG